MTISHPLPLHWQQVLLSLPGCRVRSLARPQSCELPGPDGTAMRYTLDEKYIGIEGVVKTISLPEGRMLVEADAAAGRDNALVWLRPFFVRVLQTPAVPVNGHYLTEWLGGLLGSRVQTGQWPRSFQIILRPLQQPCTYTLLEAYTGLTGQVVAVAADPHDPRVLVEPDQVSRPSGSRRACSPGWV